MNKHALVAFCDTLRREISRFKVKVISIEPAFFRTNITDTKSIVKQMKQNWDQSSDEVKSSYGSYEYEQRLIENLGKMVTISENVESVIEDIIDSIVNTHPKDTYRPIDGLSNKIQMFLALYLPTFVYDKLTLFKEKIVIG